VYPNSRNAGSAFIYMFISLKITLGRCQDVKGNSGRLVVGIKSAFTWISWAKSRKTSFSIVGVPTYIWAGHLPDRQKRYHLVRGIAVIFPAEVRDFIHLLNTRTESEAHSTATAGSFAGGKAFGQRILPHTSI